MTKPLAADTGREAGECAQIAPPGGQRLAGASLLVATAIGWGLNWPVVKLVLAVWPPLFSRGLAGIVAATALALLALATRQSLVVPRAAFPRLLLAAFTNVFTWMGFATLCMKWVSVAEGALLCYTMPIWATLFAWPIQGTRPTLGGFAALLLGMAGVVVLLGGQDLGVSAEQAWGAGFALAAAIGFALGTALNRTSLPLSPLASTAWQVGLGSLPMLAFGLAFEHPALGALTRPAFWAFVYMTLVPMGICYLTWFATLRRLPPSTASTGMLLVPLIGVVSAALMLGEPLGPREIAALVLTLGGVTLALRSR